MPRTRAPNRIPAEADSPALRLRKIINPGRPAKRQRVPGSGRRKGGQNIISRSTRQCILEGLTIAGNTMGDQGVVSYVTQAALADFRHGIALLGMITPRQADVTITRAPAPVTLAELDAELARMNLPPMREVFAVDFRGSPNPDDEAEILNPRSSKR